MFTVYNFSKKFSTEYTRNSCNSERNCFHYLFHKNIVLNRCDIIKLILQQHGEVFSVAMLNRYLQIAAILYRCKECFQELQSHGADINYLRNQPDLFDNFFRFYRSRSDNHDHAILSALYDSDIVVRSKSHFHDLCILWASKKDFCHLERSYLLLLCVIGYNVVKWSRCESKRDLLYFFNICNNIIS